MVGYHGTISLFHCLDAHLGFYGHPFNSPSRSARGFQERLGTAMVKTIPHVCEPDVIMRLEHFLVPRHHEADIADFAHVVYFKR